MNVAATGTRTETAERDVHDITSSTCSGTDDEEFDIAQFFDEFSQEWHGQFGLGHIDRLDHARTRKLRPKTNEQVGPPRNDADAIAIE